MATVSHANYIGPSPAEVTQSLYNNINQSMAGIREANKLEEEKKQNAIRNKLEQAKFDEATRQAEIANAQWSSQFVANETQKKIANASAQLQEYVKSQAGGDYAYAAQTNPSMMKQWLSVLFPNMDTDTALKNVQNGPQTYAQGVAALASELANNRVRADMFSADKSLDDVIKKLSTPSAPEGNGPKKEEDKGEKGKEGNPSTSNTFTISTNNLPTIANIDTVNLRKVLNAENNSISVPEIGKEDAVARTLNFIGDIEKNSGLSEEVINSIRNSVPYKRAKELIASGQSPDQAVTSLVSGSIIPPQEGVKLASQITPQSTETPSKGTEGVFKARIEKATPEERQLAQGLGQAAIGILQANPNKSVPEAVDEALAKIGVNSDALVRQGMLGGKIDQNLINRANAIAKSKGIQGAEGLTNLRLSIIQNVTNAVQGKNGDLGNVREGVEWTSTGVKGSPETAKALEDLGTQTGSKVSSVLKTKTISQLTDKDKAELLRDVSKASQGAIREFQVARRQDDSLDRQMVSARYSLMANSLRELGLDMPENHPAMRVISNRPQLIDEYYKTALADAARAGILTKEQAYQKWEIERKKVNVELMKLAMGKDKTLYAAYEATGKLLNDSVENWMKNNKNLGSESTNPLAEAYTKDPFVKKTFDQLVDFEQAIQASILGKKVSEVPKRTPKDISFESKNPSKWSWIPWVPSSFTGVAKFGGDSSMGDNAPEAKDPRTKGIINQWNSR